MSEPIVEVTGTTATEINERQMQAFHKMAAVMDKAKQGMNRTIVGVEYFREFVDQMKKEKEVDGLEYRDERHLGELK